MPYNSRSVPRKKFFRVGRLSTVESSDQPDSNRSGKPLSGTTDAWDTLPQGHRHAVENQLEPGETLLAWFEPDLDQRLFYNPCFLVLTDRRLLAVDTDRLEGNSPTAPATPRWQTWLLEADTTLR